MRSLVAAVERIDPLTVSGRVAAVNGLLIEARGGLTRLAVGARAEIERRADKPLAAEVVGFRETRALLMPFGPVEGVAPGAEIRIEPQGSAVRPTTAWLGRIIDAFGEPIDGLGPLPQGMAAYPLRAAPPAAHARGRVGERLDLGVRSMNVFTTCCRGQRLGVFAGSGVGKSVLLSMLAKQSDCDAVVVGLIGERGREVREFIEETLGEEGLKRAIVVVATSDEPALKRRQAAYMTLAIAEFLRDQDLEVLCMMDSVTRFAMAQREIGLAAGEPPTTKGYTPTVFTELPKLLERAGPGPIRPDGTTAGPITGIFTVLVDGDDHNEPIADAVRGILDGHIVMERSIAERGRFPAINVLKSISRTMPGCHLPHEREIVKAARQSLSAYANMEELIRIGAYRAGADPQVDRAIALNPALEAFLGQDKDEATSLDDSFNILAHILNGEAA
ncbi:flagellar protein export ATPase FliI [Phenylobacterium sp. Root77]|uniref:flagellar protein export ATPase FliI n=1 Tax=unclassified Phenylobacterium TaxID=2640670 RepID=UPI0006F86F54|nr:MULTISPECIES: flagellar protein export ATPase FliI [unclassified Phenylobacterium]KQW70555.1 flagellar protein export ATPase FliI [Phenylobacterium sp. Root1277]KQW91024.1 flagellar protein export ATPase FliI [Phenylobacterium sp. Root1290]KRC39343.1 flagellar protein export ATPase FliI [Phenylobacterium sp. Root77]